jgi:hypothetical protein
LPNEENRAFVNGEIRVPFAQQIPNVEGIGAGGNYFEPAGRSNAQFGGNQLPNQQQFLNQLNTFPQQQSMLN